MLPSYRGLPKERRLRAALELAALVLSEHRGTEATLKPLEALRRWHRALHLAPPSIADAQQLRRDLSELLGMEVVDERGRTWRVSGTRGSNVVFARPLQLEQEQGVLN